MLRSACPVRNTKDNLERKQNCGDTLPQRVPATPGTIVLSLGNPLRGDDGIGATIIERLQTDPRLPEHVTLIDAGAIQPDDLLTMSGYKQVVIVDAAEIGQPAGEWIRVRLDSIETCQQIVDMLFSTHDLRVSEIIRLGRALGLIPASIELFAVQPACMDWSIGLSEPVQEAIPHICNEILRQVQA